MVNTSLSVAPDTIVFVYRRTVIGHNHTADNEALTSVSALRPYRPLLVVMRDPPRLNAAVGSPTSAPLVVTVVATTNTSEGTSTSHRGDTHTHYPGAASRDTRLPSPNEVFVCS